MGWTRSVIRLVDHRYSNSWWFIISRVISCLFLLDFLLGLLRCWEWLSFSRPTPILDVMKMLEFFCEPSFSLHRPWSSRITENTIQEPGEVSQSIRSQPYSAVQGQGHPCPPCPGLNCNIVRCERGWALAAPPDTARHHSPALGCGKFHYFILIGFRILIQNPLPGSLYGILLNWKEPKFVSRLAWWLREVWGPGTWE